VPYIKNKKLRSVPFIIWHAKEKNEPNLIKKNLAIHNLRHKGKSLGSSRIACTKK
jgi:hypothetical protein